MTSHTPSTDPHDWPVTAQDLARWADEETINHWHNTLGQADITINQALQIITDASDRLTRTDKIYITTMIEIALHALKAAARHTGPIPEPVIEPINIDTLDI
ncbi:MAG: hypothetical protein QM705_07445 [Ancrocorticia sp.]